MTITQISTASSQAILTGQLQSEEAALNTLSQQLSTQQKYTDLTDYTPSEALTLVNLQSSTTQKQAYLEVMSTVQTRLSGYDTTMSDMESVVSQAQTLASGNPNYTASAAQGIASIAENYLKSVTVDLNQQIGGRYIYAGSRYDQAPVTDLTSLTGPPSNTVYTDGQSLPDYDTDYSAPTDFTMNTSGQTVTVDGAPSTGESASITVNGKTYSYVAQAGDTAGSVGDALATAIAADIPGTTSDGNGNVTVGATGTIDAAAATNTSTTAYTTESATIDTGYNVSYGVTSNNPAFQQMISGLQYLQAAGNTTDPDTYHTDITQAQNLLTSAMTSLTGLHATVANNINTLTAETTAQNNAITALTNQADDIQQVDLTQVSTEINLLQTQLQASYSVTGMIEKMSIVQYL